MKKWYQSGITKTILVALAQVTAIVMAISLLWISAYPALARNALSFEAVKSYADSGEFTNEVYEESSQILTNIRAKNQLETDGEYDGGKIVDIKEYHDNGKITNKNVNGIAYRLDDLVNWASAVFNNELNQGIYGTDMKDPIIVCRKTDRTYEYLYYSDMKAQVDAGELAFVLNSENWTADDIMSQLRSGEFYRGDTTEGFSAIQDGEGRVKYVDCWTYDAYWIEEKYAPVDAENLLEIVNTNPEWNGKLEQAFNMINYTINTLWDMTDSYESNLNRWYEGDTNLIYLYEDKDSETIYTNHGAYADYDKLEESLASIQKMGKYLKVTPKLKEFDSDMEGIPASTWRDHVKSAGPSENFVFAVGVDTTFPVPDEFQTQNVAFEKYAPQIRMLVLGGMFSFLLFVTVLVWLTITAGRNGRDDELHLIWFDHWKTEISAALVVGVWVAGIYLLASLWPVFRTPSDYEYDSVSQFVFCEVPEMVIAGSVAVITCAAFLIGWLSLVRRIKAKTLWKDSLLRWILHLCGQVIHNIRHLWRTILVFCGFILLHWFALGSRSEMITMMMFAAEALACVYVARRALGRQRIHDGLNRIADGEVDYQIPLQGLYGEQLEIAERINTIGEGLDAAVEKSMKSERLKTDLITNVSHDIKTPLTSIINYIDLLKRENFTDPKIQGYLEVLEAKAQRLKTLTEDVVEASKVSSGNISLEYMNINLVEMIQQTSGEFEEKFAKRNLKEILSLPEKEAVIRVDGRRMWRVLENIYNNAAKYAMEGTRVYGNLAVTEKEVIFSLKNISEQPLNIDADELTERFIRGDISRSTEGSGLGLSIAKSLTQMQGGTFELYLDGDLFKVTIRFPKA